jgi:hypothetical protein
MRLYSVNVTSSRRIGCNGPRCYRVSVYVQYLYLLGYIELTIFRVSVATPRVIGIFPYISHESDLLVPPYVPVRFVDSLLGTRVVNFAEQFLKIGSLPPSFGKLLHLSRHMLFLAVQPLASVHSLRPGPGGLQSPTLSSSISTAFCVQLSAAVSYQNGMGYGRH